MIQLIVLIFIIIISAILAIAIYQNNSKSATNLTFVGSSLSIIFWSIIMYLSVNTPSADGTLFYIRLSMLAGTILAINFLLLAICFPYATMPIKKKWVYLLIFMGVITSAIAMSPYMFTGIVVEGSNIEPTAGWGIASFMLTSIGSNIATFIVLISKFIKSKGRAKEQLRFVVIGTLIMLALLISGNFLAVIILKTSSFIFLGPLFTLTFLGSVAYAILRHKLLDIRLLIARAVSYTLVLAIVILIEAGILWVGTTILPTGIDRTLVAFAGSILIVMGYSSLRSVIEGLTEKIFFQGRYDIEIVLKKLTSIMATEMNIRLLSKQLISVLKVDIKITEAYIVLVSDFVSRPVSSLDPTNVVDPKIAKLEPMVHRVKQTMIFEELTDEADKQLFRDLNISLILPLIVSGEDIGLLVLGPKSSGDMYATRDLELLEIFAPQAAIALKNADSYRQIQEFNRTLEAKVIDRTHELEIAQASELKLKDEFVFIATHDLATPVTAISGFSAMINSRKEPLTPALKSDLGAISEASNRLKVLVNDLLQVARSDSGTIKVELVAVDAKPVIEATIREITPLANEKKVHIISALGDDNTLQADPKKLSEIVENLLSNAVKYNREGGSVTLTSKVEYDKYILEFKDTGLGIPQSEQSKVFTKFFRSEEPEVRQRPGTGLGLFVVRMLTEKMGGTITFESIEDKGTTFTLTFKR
ncbi:MAG: ATP-binding protein [bacterium]